MIPTKLVKYGLMATAVLNLVSGTAAVLAPSVNAQILLGPDVVLDGLLLRYHLIMWLFVAAMGVGYGAASRDPERQTALVLCGGIGKLCAVAVWLEMLVSGYGRAPMFLGVLWDGTLGVIFLLFALGLREQPRVSPA